MSLKSKLQRMKSHLAKDAPSQLVPSPPSRDIPYLPQWEELQAKPFFFENEYIMIRETRYPLSYRHGRYSFEKLPELVEQWNQGRASHPLSTSGTQASDLLFFDTETTGLHGGTGNTIFLLGYARVLSDQVIVKQYFLPGPHEEVAFYQGFLSDVRELKNLVTYNGKAFDWPQVKTRHTLLRDLVPQLPLFGHYDLLHGSRRLWKDHLPSCRLSIVEQQILGVHRQDDTPGYMAPLLYFDFLKEQDPSIMKGVLEHNEWDVLSLITLYIHLSSLLQGRDLAGCTPHERFQIGRWYEQAGDQLKAVEFYRSCQDLQPAQLSLAALYKKMKDWDQAIALWEQVAVGNSPLLTEVYTELSKGYEHHRKDYERALFYADKAYETWKLYRKKLGKEKEPFVKRMERLEKKCKLR